MPDVFILNVLRFNYCFEQGNGLSKKDYLITDLSKIETYSETKMLQWGKAITREIHFFFLFI